MDKDKALQAFDGLLVSDGALSRAISAGDPPEVCYGIKNSRFHISQSSEHYDHIDWMYYIKSVLLVLGVGVSSCFPKFGSRTSRGKLFKLCELSSLTSPWLTGQRKRWYPQGVKEVPEDFEFTPVSLANAWMGDGNSAKHMTSQLSTPSYNLHSIEIIERALHEAGIIHTGRAHRETGCSGIIITVSRESAVVLRSTIEPWMLPSFKYKVEK